MPCRSPLTGYRKSDGSLAFQRADTTGRFALRTVQCGVCRDCRLAKARDWAIRCANEAQMHERSCWVTLTFETDPITIAKRDVQIFIRRLRRRGHKFSYYAVGEYGEKLGRPHYHICLFGFDPPDRYHWRRTKRGHLIDRSPMLEKVWRKGFVEVSPLTLENAGYTARYTMKKIGGDIAANHYQREYRGLTVPIHPEFALMSLKPPIGKRWIEKYWRDVFPADRIIYKGKEKPVPRYYYNWLQVNHPDVFEVVQAKRQEHIRNKDYETGLRMHQAAHARDCRTKSLNDRNLENVD